MTDTSRPDLDVQVAYQAWLDELALRDEAIGLRNVSPATFDRLEAEGVIKPKRVSKRLKGYRRRHLLQLD